jgi:hypothetical protein
MKFTGSFLAFTIDMEGYKKALHSELKERLAEAAFQYLDAVLAKVPVWSGASAATFLQLAKTIDFPLQIDPVSQLGLGISFGEAHGSGKFDDGSKEGLFFFTYATTLAHLIYNENADGNQSPGPGQRGLLRHPGPYHFQEAGQAAFEKVAKVVRLPNPFLNLKFRRIQVK